MNPWFRRLLLILTIGGGFMGIAFTTQLFSQAKNVFACIILLGFIVLYGWGVFLGLQSSEGAPRLGQLRAYFGFQVPFFSSPIYVYQFCSGFHFTLSVIQSSLQWEIRLGSEMQFAYLAAAPWGIGLNVFALAILVLLYSRLAGPPKAEET